MNENKSACAVFAESETVSQWKHSFICANDDLHHALLNSPLAVFIYVFGVLLVMFLVQRATRPIRKTASQKTAGQKTAGQKTAGQKTASQNISSQNISSQNPSNQKK